MSFLAIFSKMRELPNPRKRIIWLLAPVIDSTDVYTPSSTLHQGAYTRQWLGRVHDKVTPIAWKMVCSLVKNRQQKSRLLWRRSGRVNNKKTQAHTYGRAETLEIQTAQTTYWSHPFMTNPPTPSRMLDLFSRRPSNHSTRHKSIPKGKSGTLGAAFSGTRPERGHLDVTGTRQSEPHCFLREQQHNEHI